MTNNIQKMILSIVLIVTLVGIVNAVAVARPYWDENPLKLAPGESKIITLNLQSDTNEEVTVESEIQSEIATLVDGTSYLVSPGDMKVPVRINVKMPENSETGITYPITVTFKEIASGEGGMVQFTGAATITFPAKAVAETESELYSTQTERGSYLWIYLLISAIIIVLLIILVVKKQNVKKQKKK